MPFCGEIRSPSPFLENRTPVERLGCQVSRAFFSCSTSPHLAVERDRPREFEPPNTLGQAPDFIMTLQAQLPEYPLPVSRNFPALCRETARTNPTQPGFNVLDTVSAWKLPTPKRYQGLQVIPEPLSFDPESAVMIAGATACEASADAITSLP